MSSHYENNKNHPPEVAAIIPLGQYAVTEEHPDTFAEAIERLTAQVRKCPRIGGTEGMDRTLVHVRLHKQLAKQFSPDKLGA
jgi:hypothetical protein